MYDADKGRTLYAQWVKSAFSVSYDPNGGGGEEMEPDSIRKGATGTVKENTYTAPNTSKVFAGWSTDKDATEPTYQPGVTLTDLSAVLPDFACQGIRAAIPLLGRRLRGFDHPDALLTGVEARSSSPVRIPRNEKLESNIAGLYPAGEGAGYAGGIMSAATDGLRCAEALIASHE